MRNLILVFGLGGHYDALGRRLTVIGAKPNGRSAWLLRETKLTVEALRADLCRFLHPSDELIIEEVAQVA
ncbi:MAG: hypothetical protein LAO79_16460 [Acidobacteriia bacterium]|nr:hypothetical protein [Terriglobia bacterium]